MRPKTTTVLVCVALIVFAALIVLATWPLPIVLTRALDVSLEPNEFATAVNATRSALLTSVGTLGAGITVATAFLSYRAGKAAGFTDRYSKAVDQMGSDDSTVKIGGLHAIGRLAQDSATDRPAVGDVLSAFIRNTPPAQNEDGEQQVGREVQVALDILGGMTAGRPWRGSDLRGAKLALANLSGLSFRQANLSGVDLSGADLTNVDLREARLTGGDLMGAKLVGAKLRGVDLRECRLRGAELSPNALTSMQKASVRWD